MRHPSAGKRAFLALIAALSMDAIAAGSTNITATAAPSAAPSAQVIDVDSFGARPDGVTDASPAIDMAVSRAGSGPTVIQFSTGVYLLSRTHLLRASNVTYRGAGLAATTLRLAAGAGQVPLVESSSASPVTHVAFEGLTFDWNTPAPGDPYIVTGSVVLSGTGVNDVSVSRCRFWRSPSGALSLDHVHGAVIEDSVFESPGDATSDAISVGSGSTAVTIRRNRVRYTHDGIIVWSRGPASANDAISITDNRFDLGWWTLVPRVVGAGATVGYTPTTLTDPRARFIGLQSGANENVRAMPVLATGMRASYTQQSLFDPSALFDATKILPGHIVRAGGAFAVVSRVTSGRSLVVEEWLSDADRTPVGPPASRTPYMVYGIAIGRVVSFTPTTITTDRWHDLSGASVVPPAGTRYEVLPPRPNYPIHVDYASVGSVPTVGSPTGLVIRGNILLRGWSDQISVYRHPALIDANTLRDGQDMGITVDGAGFVVTANTVARSGAANIYCSCSDSLVQSNDVVDSPWQNNQNNTDTLGEIIVRDGNRTRVAQNVTRRVGAVLNYYGIVLSGASSRNALIGNAGIGHPAAAIELLGNGVSGTVLSSNIGRVLQLGSVGTVYG